MLRSLFAASLVVALVAFPLATVAAERPNIVWIMADDLGYGDLGCYGQEEIRTPRIDRLARQGVRFTQCYAGSTVCAPTRCVLMTGKHTGHATVRGNSARNPETRESILVPLTPEDVTVAEVLKQAGYATGVCGKWGLGEPETTGVPNLQGFDRWLGFLNQKHAHGYYPEFLWRNQEILILDDNLGGHQGIGSTTGSPNSRWTSSSRTNRGRSSSTSPTRFPTAATRSTTMLHTARSPGRKA